MTTDIIGCKRGCEIMNRPAYIVLFKGDDSDFQGNQSVDIVINTELDTTGMKAHFRFMDFVQDFDSIPENKTLSLVFPNAKTSEFPLGASDATLRFEDASGKFRTVSNRIHIVVTNSVHEAYNNEDSQSITVTVKGTVTWDMIEGKPTIPAPVTVDPALSQTSENPVQNKVVTKALYTGFTEWVCDSIEPGYTFTSCIWADYMDSTGWVCTMSDDGGELTFYLGSNQEATSLSHTSPFIVITRHLVTPTKTSQLTNDGPSSGPNVGHPFATTNQIPAPVDISGKLDGAAAYPAWYEREYNSGSIVSYNGRLWRADEDVLENQVPGDSPAWSIVTIDALKQDALTSAQLAAANSGATAAKVAAWDGYAAQIAAKANSADVNAALAQKANTTDLPYRMVMPGEWEFSGLPEGATSASVAFNGFDEWTLTYVDSDEVAQTDFVGGNENDIELDFPASGITATRASLPGHLLDRAGNRVVVSGDTTLTLPALEHAGRLRDFLVRLEISGSTVPTITFQGQGSEAPNGADEIIYETDGDEFPVPDEAGTWLYSFTESCVAHKFAVSLKKVNEVAQGGS